MEIELFQFFDLSRIAPSRKDMSLICCHGSCFHEVLARLKKQAKIGAISPVEQYNLGVMYFSINRLTEAEQHIRKAIFKSPQDTTILWRQMYIKLLFSLGRWSEICRQYAAISDCCYDADVTYLTGLCTLVMRGKLTARRKAFELMSLSLSLYRLHGDMQGIEWAYKAVEYFIDELNQFLNLPVYQPD
ncbi:hypothetical protein [Synechococcus sp. PCC 7336]|uniref:hypothetical protein n=1 Tax=Synechococcus sp. PCC 7336 TaxID=195250 RepID=UPI0003617D66|nr:hypothetical protein [Synechococcus sp. PCC 7336]